MMLSLKSSQFHLLDELSSSSSDTDVVSYHDSTLRGSTPEIGVAVHRIMLASASPYLKSILDDVPRCAVASIVIPEIDLVTLQRFVSFLYSGRLTCHESDCRPIIDLMELLQMDTEHAMSMTVAGGERNHLTKNNGKGNLSSHRSNDENNGPRENIAFAQKLFRKRKLTYHSPDNNLIGAMLSNIDANNGDNGGAAAAVAAASAAAGFGFNIAPFNFNTLRNSESFNFGGGGVGGAHGNGFFAKKRRKRGRPPLDEQEPNVFSDGSGVSGSVVGGFGLPRMPSDELSIFKFERNQEQLYIEESDSPVIDGAHNDDGNDMDGAGGERGVNNVQADPDSAAAAVEDVERPDADQIDDDSSGNAAFLQYDDDDGQLYDEDEAAAEAAEMAAAGGDDSGSSEFSAGMIDPGGAAGDVGGDFPCSQCSKHFRSQQKMENHARKFHATGNDRYQCDQCDYRSNLLGNIRRHTSSVHIGEKRFACRVCEKKFTTKVNLDQHETSVHLKLKPFQCNYCSASFGYRDSLKSHLIKVHNIVSPLLLP